MRTVPSGRYHATRISRAVSLPWRCVVSSRRNRKPAFKELSGMSSGALDPASFANFVPLNALRPESQRDLAKKASVGQAKAGDYLFKIGEQAKAALYVLSGEIALEDASG